MSSCVNRYVCNVHHARLIQDTLSRVCALFDVARTNDVAHEPNQDTPFTLAYCAPMRAHVNLNSNQPYPYVCTLVPDLKTTS